MFENDHTFYTMFAPTDVLHNWHEQRPSNTTNSVAPEPAGSSPYLQEPATGPYPEPTGSIRHTPPSLPQIHSDPILPPTSPSSEGSLSLGLSHQKHSNSGDHYWSTMGEGWESLIYGRRSASGFIFVPQHMIVRFRFKWCTLYFRWHMH
jgi:hypothetical protein